jgi:hypothetical protein
MARIPGVERGGGLITRLVFFLVRRRLGRVPRPVRITALRPTVLLGYGLMEQAQLKASALGNSLKKLAQVRVAMRVGCPF